MRSRQSSDALETSDVEITRPDNGPPYEQPTGMRPWHVHLELRPEQLLTLHRLGFTGGALAWREGMDDWQPLREGGEPGEEPEPPVATAPLARVTPLDGARRRAHRDSSNPPPPQAQPPARVTPFAQARASVPPIANALPVPLVRLRRPVERAPAPPPIEDRIPQAPLPSFASEVPTALPDFAPARAPTLASYETKPMSVPPIAIEPAPSAARPVTSRAVLLGAAALVALSASNGALVSALVWSLRHEAKPPAADASAAAEGRQPAPPLEAAPVSPAQNAASNAGKSPAESQPLSLEQLPLAGTTRNGGESSKVSSSEAGANSTTRASSSATRSTSTSSRRSGRRSPAAVVLDEDAGAAHARKPVKVEEPAEIGPPDRKAMAKAIGRAAGAAASCAPGPETGRVSVTFAPSGNVQSVSLLLGFGDAGINSCVMRAMGRAKVRPFSGESITVQKSLNW